MALGTTLDAPDTAWQQQGAGEPLVLIPGLACDQSSWGPFAHHLALSARVVTFDHRGIGETAATRGPYTIPALASDVLRLLDRIGLERADILGVSMGGMVALELAASYPDRVRSLVLGCAHPGGKMQILPEQGVIDKLPSLGKSMEQMVGDYLAVVHSARFLARHEEDFRELLAHRIRTNFSRRTYVLQLGAIMTHDVGPRLSQIHARTLILAGDDDQLVPLANAILLADRIRNARLAVLHDVGHAFWKETPERAAHEVTRFLEEPTIAAR